MVWAGLGGGEEEAKMEPRAKLPLGIVRCDKKSNNSLFVGTGQVSAEKVP